MRWFRRRPAGDPLELSLTWEAGEEVDPAWQPERAAVIAHWSGDGTLSRSIRTLAGDLAANGFEVLLVSAAGFEGPRPGMAEPLPRGVTLLRRPNSGYDFGTWSAVLAAFPGLPRAAEVALANDSMVGPFAPLAPVLRRMSAVECDVWSMTESEQFSWHPQSYFVVYRGGVLAQQALADFWSGVRVHDSKRDIIWNYELGQGQLLRREGLHTEAAFPAAPMGIPSTVNPTIKAWRALLAAGLPMVKRQLITEPEVAEDSAEVSDEVRRRFAADVKEWL